MMKAFILGLDGMTLRVLEPYTREGLLPNFRKVMKGGAHGVLRSTIPPTTPPGWTSLATGKNPGKHGVFEFVRREGYDTHVITRTTSPNADPIWNILSRSGRNSIVLNVPCTYPPDPVQGMMVSGFMTPSLDKEFVHPPERKQEIFDLIPDYTIDLDEREFIFSKDKDLLRRKVFTITDNLGKLMNHYLRSESWDLFFIVFTGPDRIQHFLWDQILEFQPECVQYYQRLDRILGDILKQIEDEAVLFIVSDHGFMPIRKGFYLNNFLQEQGLLQFSGGQSVKTALSSVNSLLNQVGFLRLKDVLPQRLLNYLRNFSAETLGVRSSDIDWERTQVFSLLGTIIDINLKGREPLGTVEPEDYDRVCEKVREALLAVRDPETGAAVVKKVHRGAQIYGDVRGENVPDLLVETHEGYAVRNELGSHIFDDNTVGNVRLIGEHEIDGLFMAYGSPLMTGKFNASVYDIMPTVLHLMGQEIPEDVDGRVLTEIIRDDFLHSNPIRFGRARQAQSPGGDTLTDDEDTELRERLRGLGYLR